MRRARFVCLSAIIPGLALALACYTGGSDEGSGGGESEASAGSTTVDPGGMETGELPDSEISCTDRNDCQPSEICSGASRCTSAWGHRYRIRVQKILVAETKSGGENWDPLGDAPDPFWELWIDGALVMTAPVVKNSFEVAWPDVYTARLAAAVAVEFRFYDEDASEHDIIDSYRWPEIPESSLHEGEWAAGGKSSTISVSFELVDGS